MSWLATLIADIAIMLIKSLGGDLSDYLKQKEAEAKSQAANAAEANASVSDLKKATTGEDIEKAAHDAFDKT